MRVFAVEPGRAWEVAGIKNRVKDWHILHAIVWTEGTEEVSGPLSQPLVDANRIRRQRQEFLRRQELLGQVVNRHRAGLD